jgi:hypothetical protein
VSHLAFDRCALVAEAPAAQPLRRSLEEARAYLAEITGAPVISGAAAPRATPSPAPARGELLIAVGGEPSTVVSQLNSPEAFRVSTGMRSGRAFACVAGASPIGTARGLSRLLGMIEVSGRRARLPALSDAASAPRFALRGMHLNGWAASHPYAFRCWSEEDWQRYVDMLFHEGVNLLFLWPSIDIIPSPLSREDEEYLQEVRRVVAYAREQRGMEVWALQSANRIALSDCGVRDPRLRPYWLPEFQVDLDPGDPEQLDAILRSREPLYRIVDNIDGLVIIDSDPGGWKGSPVRAYITLLQRTRAMLDRHAAHGPGVKLVSWLWQGWGCTSWDPGNREPVIAETVALMREALPEPWMLIAGTGHYLPFLRRLGVLDRTVYLPYGAIEAEPSLPFTNVDPGAIRGALDGLTAYPGIAGVMGNVQCPVLQMPQVHHLMAGAWDFDGRARPDADGLSDLARLLHPAQARPVAEAFAALNATTPEEIDGALSQVRRISESADTLPGLLGRLLFPTPRQALSDLASQLRVRRAEAAFACALEASAGAAALAPLLTDYFRECLGWESRHGFFAVMRVGRLNSLFPRPPIPRDTVRTWPPLLPYAARLGKTLEDAGDPGGKRFFAPVLRRLADEFDEEKVTAGCIEAMRIMMERHTA